MKKYFSLFACSLLYIGINAQNLSISPYSAIGIGEIKFDQDVVLGSMGSTYTTAVSEFGSELNFSNPAANRNLNFTVFGATLGNDLIQYKGDGIKENRSASYLSNLSIGFPVSKKVNAGIGFQPYSATNYKVSRVYLEADPVKAVQYTGEGGANSVHSFVSYNVNDKLSLGVRANYLFGNIDKKQEIGLSEVPTISSYRITQKVKALQFTTGATYTKILENNKRLTFGATYRFTSNLNSEINSLQTTYYNSPESVPLNIDTISYQNYDVKSKLGSSMSVGVALNKTLKYRIALEAQFKNASEYNFEDNYYDLNNSYRVAVGGWFIPDINSYKSYFQRMTYRYGVYYQKGELSLQDEDINQFGITFGFGLPVGKKGFQDPSMINIGLDLGKRGTTNNNLIQENFANIKIGLNFNDLWFRKRKYN